MSPVPTGAPTGSSKARQAGIGRREEAAGSWDGTG